MGSPSRWPTADPFLLDVERGLGAQLESPEGGGTLLETARYLCLGGGKRARPMLVKTFGEALGVPGRALLDSAVAAELIHAASLLHDDVVDAGMFRRGRPTVNARWGNLVAVMSGDFLLAGALSRLCARDSRLAVTALATVAEMTRAAMTEVEVRGALQLPLAALRRIAEGKTGTLFGWCGVAASIEASAHGATRYLSRIGRRQPKSPSASLASGVTVELPAAALDAARRFEAFGRRLGIAFQIADDIGDVTGAEAGKPQYADLRSRTPSYPVLLAASDNTRLRRRIEQLWSWEARTPEKLKEVGTAVLVSGAIDEATRLLRAEIEGAVVELGPYVEQPAGARLVSLARRLAQGPELRGAA